MKGAVPKQFIGRDVQLIININGEGCIYDEKGNPVKGLSKILSVPDALGSVTGKLIYKLPENTQNIDLWVETGNNGFDARSTGWAKFKRADITLCNEKLNNLYYDFITLYLLLTELQKTSEKYNVLLTVIKDALKALKNYTDEEIERASAILKSQLSLKTQGDDDFTFYATGHAHLDLAWEWPIRETKRKAARTFSNQLNLIDNHKDYVFGASQPQQFQWMKDLYPGLFQRMKAAVISGALEPQGGMWVEADSNLTSGESLVRQVLYGKRFFRSEFNKDMKILWLPDVFGFSGALPQIIKKAGMDYFLTIKLSWNEHNKFPYNSFIWEGIDGSPVLVHMPPEGDYNSQGTANSIMDAFRRYKEK
jgi:alpha-mannosidase